MSAPAEVKQLSVADAYDRLETLVGAEPVDGLWEGYRTTEETKQDQRLAAALLCEVAALLRRCIAREELRWRPYAKLHARRERLEWAQRGTQRS